MKMIKLCVHAGFCKSPNWLQVIRPLLFCVPVQAKPKVSMFSHPSQSSRDQARATLSQEASLAALGIAAKSDLFKGMCRHRLFPWHPPASCNQHGTRTKHHTCAQCTTSRAPAWGVTYTTVSWSHTF